MSVIIMSVMIISSLFMSLLVPVIMTLELKVSSFMEVILDFHIMNDFMSILFSMTVIIIFMSVLNWSMFYMSSDYNLNKFYLLFTAFMISMLILLFSKNLFLVFLGWEGLGVTSVALIIFYQNWDSSMSSLLTMLTNRLGDGIMMIMLCSSLLTSALLNSSWVIICLSMLTLTKSAQWPFMAWLPAAMAAPTPVSALVHSSTLVTAGVWLILRFSFVTLLSSKVWILLGSLTLVTASLAALLEQDGKKLVALSTLSQLGLMFISVSFSNKFSCFIHLLSHAFAKANLFLVVGSIIFFHFNDQDNRNIYIMKKKALLFSAVISLYSLSGNLFSSGFLSKDMILSSSAYSMNSVISLLFIVSLVIVTFSYCMKLLYILSYNKTPKSEFIMEENSFLSNSSLLLVGLCLTSSLSLVSNTTTTLISSLTYSSLVWTGLMISVLGVLISSQSLGFILPVMLNKEIKNMLFLMKDTQFLESNLEHLYTNGLLFFLSKTWKLLSLVSISSLMIFLFWSIGLSKLQLLEAYA